MKEIYLLRPILKRFIGSEGGFSPSEVEKAKEAGYISVSLGKRILRSETAVFYALSTIGFVLENK